MADAARPASACGQPVVSGQPPGEQRFARTLDQPRHVRPSGQQPKNPPGMSGFLSTPTAGPHWRRTLRFQGIPGSGVAEIIRLTTDVGRSSSGRVCASHGAGPDQRGRVPENRPPGRRRGPDQWKHHER